MDSDDDTWSPLDSDDSDSEEGDVSAGKDEPNEDEKKHQRCLSKEVPKHKWSVTKAVMNRYMTFIFLKSCFTTIKLLIMFFFFLFTNLFIYY